MAGIKTLNEQDAPAKKKNKNALVIMIIAAIVVALLLIALFLPSNNFKLPAWMQERMQYQKTSVSLPAHDEPGSANFLTL